MQPLSIIATMRKVQSAPQPEDDDDAGTATGEGHDEVFTSRIKLNRAEAMKDMETFEFWGSMAAASDLLTLLEIHGRLQRAVQAENITVHQLMDELAMTKEALMKDYMYRAPILDPQTKQPLRDRVGRLVPGPEAPRPPRDWHDSSGARGSSQASVVRTSG